jgi:hypothetical protein
MVLSQRLAVVNGKFQELKSSVDGIHEIPMGVNLDLE